MTSQDETDTQRSSEPVGDPDPLLVRPWLAGAASTTRWDTRADRPARPAAHRAVASPIVLPGPPAPVRARPDRRRGVLVVVAVVVALAALTVAGYAAFAPGGRATGGPPAAAPAFSLPPLSTPAASPPPPRTGPAPAGVRPPGTPPAGAARVHRNPASARPAPASAGPVTVAPATVSAPPPAPATARIGTIVGDGGRCLDLNGGIPDDGNHIQVFDCNGTEAQAWTLQTDGTLRVQGLCAQQTGDTVHVTSCDSRPAEQWRAGPDGALLNLSSGGCLTDPDHGAANSTPVTVTPCTGGRDPDQRWTVAA